MLRRFADARLRSALARETEAKENAIHLARAIAVRLKAARAANVALAADLAAERARIDAALAHDPMPGFPCGNPNCPCQVTAAAAIDAAERARTQETTGRCGKSLHTGFGDGPLICALPAGHAGWHRDDNRAEWGPITEVTKP